MAIPYFAAPLLCILYAALLRLFTLNFYYIHLSKKNVMALLHFRSREICRLLREAKPIALFSPISISRLINEYGLILNVFGCAASEF